MNNYVDEYGNRLILLNNKWELVLNGKTRRIIGEYRDGVLKISRKRDKHTYRRLDAYGLCDAMLQNTLEGAALKVVDDKGTYVIPMSKVNENKLYDSFEKSEGFEKQSFLEIDFIEEYKI